MLLGAASSLSRDCAPAVYALSVLYEYGTPVDASTPDITNGPTP
ncbi:unannotated protein [freshwater metagenome]|uniref:Unannotated protein n=1 Tax=freshwater metagenome TaxID=449393 RepID=A0A6J6DRR5_9ZZZZ